MKKPAPPTAVVMNMFYTGLGIARSLGEQGIPVIGLTSQHFIYGNFTRYATIRRCPDSRNEPEALLGWLQQMGKELGSRSILFPTRDDDVAFLDRFREALQPYFILTIPESNVVNTCLSKWETFLCAAEAGVNTPTCWLIENRSDVLRLAPNATYPCVLKPVMARDWRRGANWSIVGARKAIAVTSSEELVAAYDEIARAEPRAVVQEMVLGADDCLVIAACYLDRNSKFVAGFNTRKLCQIPEGFGTGCIVETVDRPELFEPAIRLLQHMRFTGIAEVEFKWDASVGAYRLIEINPRAWDQHRLGAACGTDLILLAYCEHAGWKMPKSNRQAGNRKWVAEDVLCMNAFRSLWKRDPHLLSMLRLARGKRVWAIWSARDPLPAIAFFITRFFPGLIRLAFHTLLSTIKRKLGNGRLLEKDLIYENDFTKGKSPS